MNNNEELFYTFFNDKIKELHISDEEIVKEFGMSLSAIQRWKNKTNAPHPSMRKHVIEWLTKRTNG